MSDQGALRLCWSVGHVGPIAASARDCALGYLVCAQAPGEGAPLGDRLQTISSARRWRACAWAIYRPWFQHAQPQVVRVCEALLAALERRGARLVEVTLPGLEAIRLAQGLTIAAEIAAALEPVYAAGKQPDCCRRRRASTWRWPGGRTASTTCRPSGCGRRRWRRSTAAFDEVDVLVTPTTGDDRAPAIRPDASSAGESDLSVLTELMRFVVAANFVGVPAISFPAGFDGAGLPVGLQAMAPWWQERRLLHLAHAAEQDVAWRRPAWFHAAPLS